MKNIKLLILGLIITLAACKAKNDTEMAAKELCSCLKPMVEVYKQLQSEEALKDSSLMENLMTNFEKAAQESQACSDRMTQKYGDLVKQQDEVRAAMQKNCPDIVHVLDEFSDTK